MTWQICVPLKKSSWYWISPKGIRSRGKIDCFSILFLVSNASAQKIHHIWFLMRLLFTHSPASSVKEPLHIPRKATLGCNTAHKTVSDTEQSITRCFMGQWGQQLSHIRHTGWEEHLATVSVKWTEELALPDFQDVGSKHWQVTTC